MQSQITIVKLSNVVPDTVQPRKYFNAEKIKNLKNSISQHGIVNPLIVQEIGKGQYLLVDGERRFRAATELKMDKVPVIIEPVQKDTERLVRQFNIQEQHEQWTPTEKAIAIDKLSATMGLTLPATCKLLNVTINDTRRYIAFSSIIDKDTWQKNEVPLEYAGGIQSLKNTARRLSENELEKEFTRADEKKLEHRIIALVKSGAMEKRTDLTRLKDAFVKDSKSIEKFLSTVVTPMALFISTKAKGTHHLRNVAANARYVTMHTREFMKLKDVRVTEEHVATFKTAIESLKEMVALAK